MSQGRNHLVRANRRHLRSLIAARVRRGDFVGALDLYGHAERLGAVWRWWSAGRGSLRDALAEAWQSAEYPGTAHLGLWRAIAADERIEDGEPMPAGDPLVVYRGQGNGEPVGISWTLDRETAAWFARNLPRLGPRPDGGLVLVGRVRRDRVLAYLTSRGEREVIVDPHDVARFGDIATRALLTSDEGRDMLRRQLEREEWDVRDGLGGRRDVTSDLPS